MVKNGISFIFNDSNAKNNFPKMDSKFLNLLGEFAKKYKIQTLSVNSTYRPKNNGSYHYKGMALDVHFVKFTNGKTIYFTAREKTYNIVDDDYFYSLVKDFFKNYKFEYISPARIKTPSADRHNRYRYDSRTDKVKILDQMKTKKLPYEINRDHLHHLHLAFNPTPNTIKIVANKTAENKNSIIPIVGLVIIGFLLYKKGVKNV
jgi:hypothetical protein